MAVQACFDLAELNAVTAPLDHPVAPAEECVIAVRLLDHHVSGFVPSRPCLVGQKHSRCLLRKAPISLHDATTGHTELAFFTGADLASLFIHRFRSQVRTGYPD